MLYDSIVARSFSKHEQKKLSYGALICCFFVAIIFCIFLEPHLSPFPVLSLRLSMDVNSKMLMIKDSTTSFEHKITKVEENVTERTEPEFNITNFQKNIFQERIETVSKSNTTISYQALEGTEIEAKRIIEPVCTFMERTDFCDIREQVRIDKNSSTVFIASTHTEYSEKNESWSIRPYARKRDTLAMSRVTEWSVKQSTSQTEMPRCTQIHSVPAVLFSSGGYVGNHFHEFTDVIIPLFITSRKFDGEVEFLITDRQSWWIKKYQEILKKLSNYKIIDIDREMEEVHCFPSVSVGLNRHEKELSIDPLKHSYSMKDFKDFLRSLYSLKRGKAIKIRSGEWKKPRLLIVSRRKTRSFTNIKDISKMGRRLGFKVIVSEPNMNIRRVAEMVNSCDVVMGVHGAGLTNIVFLPENAVFIQIVPFGGVEWVATNFFGNPSQNMSIKYLEYKMSIEESTLTQQYPLDHLVLRDPPTIQRQGWQAFKSIYLDKQNVNLNVEKFKPTLLKALELLHQ